MDIVVCVKHVPDTTEAEIAIRDDGRGIKKEGLVFDISEADNYAIEEALVLKEEFDGAEDRSHGQVVGPTARAPSACPPTP